MKIVKTIKHIIEEIRTTPSRKEINNAFIEAFNRHRIITPNTDFLMQPFKEMSERLEAENKKIANLKQEMQKAAKE